MAQENRMAPLAAWVEDIRTGLAVRDVFEVELDRLPTLREELREVAAISDQARRDARRLAGVEAPAGDEASVRSVTGLRELIEGGEVSFLRICEDIHAWVVGFLAEVEAAIAARMVGAPA